MEGIHRALIKCQQISLIYPEISLATNLSSPIIPSYSKPLVRIFYTFCHYNPPTIPGSPPIHFLIESPAYIKMHLYFQNNIIIKIQKKYCKYLSYLAM